MNDQLIWGKIVRGDVDGLRILHDKYYQQMWLWGNKYMQDNTMTEELVSDCFIKLWSQRKQIIIEKSLRSYLFLMLRNNIISHARNEKKHHLIGYDQIPEIPEEENLNNQDFYADLYRAINRIPEQRRRILELAVFESMTYKEIAAHLNISVNTVKTQMGRAYQFLKEELDPKTFILLQLFRGNPTH